MRTVYYGLMLAALLCAGCVTPNFVWPEDNPATPPPQAEPVVRKHVPAVRPDQVTSENAGEKVQALEEELNSDSEMPAPSVGGEAPPPAPKK